MERTTLQVTPRTITGKKVRQLRKAGLVPGHIFGYQTDPINIAIERELFKETYRNSGETSLIDLHLEGKKLPVLIVGLQRHAVTGDYLNVDFHKVNLKEKVTVSVPITLVGEAEAVAQKIGLLEQPIAEVEIEALPTDLIEEIELDVTNLKEIDDALYVSDLKVPATITIMAEPETMICKIGALEMPEVEEEAPVAEGEEGATEGEATENTDAEGTEPVESTESSSEE